MRQNERKKIYMLTSYVAPRKRKPITWSCSGVDLSECIQSGRDFLGTHGGKFVKAFWTICDCYDLPMGDGSERVVTMKEISFANVYTDIALELLGA